MAEGIANLSTQIAYDSPETKIVIYCYIILQPDNSHEAAKASKVNKLINFSAPEINGDSSTIRE